MATRRNNGHSKKVVTGGELPVHQWLRMGAAAAGLVAALSAASGVAAADEATASSQAAGPVSKANVRSEASSRARNTGPAASTSPAAVKPAARPAAVADSRPRRSAAPIPTAQLALADPSVSTVTSPVGTANPTASSVGASAATANPLADVASFFGLPATPSSSPTVESVGLYVGLQLGSLFKPPTDPGNTTAVITGLFREILRRDPSTTELQSYTNVLNVFGLNGVAAGVYSSSEFHQTELQGYYNQMLGRPASAAELALGTLQLAWGIPEPVIVAGIAASPEFYRFSDQSSGAPAYQNQPAVAATATPTSFVNLLYRSLLGQAPDPTVAQSYIQQLSHGIPSGLVALQFVLSDAYRAVQVKDIYQVVAGQNVADTGYSVTQYVDNWFLSGGLHGITTQFLTSSANITRMNAAGGIPLPDMVSAAVLQQILLAAYTGDANGFVELLKQGLKQTIVNGEPAPCQTDCASAEALRALIASGGPTRGIPNSSIVITPAAFDAPAPNPDDPATLPSDTAITYVNVNAVRPTQNDIDMKQSIKYPLQNADSLTTYLQGGDVIHATGRILTADNGQYVLDGHHRWSTVFIMNPNARIASVDIGYVPNAQDGLKETQLAIAAQLGYLPFKVVDGNNLFTVDETTFKDTVAQYITTGPDGGAPVMQAFATYKNLQDMTAVQNYLWANVLQMRQNNLYVVGATARTFMPQPVDNDYTPLLKLMDGQVLSYTFPVVSYLG